jgi:putative ABC transport system ATP-binding protein
VSHEPKEVISCRGLERWFQAGDQKVRALRGVSFTIHQGEFVAIMGPSGSGKSTLLYQLGCLDNPSAGELSLCGEVPSGMADSGLSDLRKRHIGFVFQSFNLLSRATILQNVALPMRYAGVSRREARDRAISLLTRVGLAERVEHKPTELSGGQCQRAAIARALANDPVLILADEPTGNLDQKTGREIMALFHELREEGKTLVMVTHDEVLSRNTTRILRMRDGLLEGDEILVEGSCPSRKPLGDRYGRQQETRRRDRLREERTEKKEIRRGL